MALVIPAASLICDTDMSLKERIAEDIKKAMKAGERDTVGALRMVSSRILEKEVELRADKGKDYQLTDDETVAVISSYAKQRHQSIESYRQGGRDDLVAKEEAELALLQEYLPRQLTEREIETLVDEVIAETGAAGPAEMGKVMGALMPRVKGQADGKLVNEIVRRKLA